MSDLTSPVPTPPAAERRPEAGTHHGHTRVDDYGWIAEVDNPAVLDLLRTENEYSAAMTGHLEGLRTQVFDEIVARTRTDDVSVPARRGPWWYFQRSIDGQQYPVVARVAVQGAGRESWDPPSIDSEPLPGEQVLLDCNAEAGDASFFALGALEESPDHCLLGYSVDEAGDERFTVRIKDLATGAIVDDAVRGVGYGLTWDARGTGFYYTVLDEAWRPFQVRWHALGTSMDADQVLYTDHDERFWVGVDLSTSRRFLLVGSGSKLTSEHHVLDLLNPDAGLTLVAARREGVDYDIDHAVIEGVDRLVIVHNGTDENGTTASDFMVSVADVGDPDPAHWRTLVPHTPGTRISGATCLTRAIALSVRRDGLAQVDLLSLTDGGVGAPRTVPAVDELFTMGVGGVSDPDSPYLRLGYTTFVTPSAVYDCDLETTELVLRKQTEVLDVDLSAFTAHREWAVAADGTRVPISVVHRRDLQPDGRNPVLLYGYGAYEAPMDPAFRVPRLSLLERGVVYAVAHVRGGGELGRAWWEAGSLNHKKNSFTDFVSCATALVESGWADPERMVAMGGSAGGLLMGAVANLAPERFAGVVASVPFVDTLTTMLDPSLPLTVIEREEWGDPLNDPQAYDYICSYAPYEQVAAVRYPPILALTSLNDTRVRYVEPAKWIAKLRQVAPDGGPYLLKTDLDSGHGGGSGRYTAWRETAYEFAWVLDRLGLA